MIVSKPKISIIMSVYNNSNTIEAAIESILEQTYKDFELLILDDGSTDNTKLILPIALALLIPREIT